MTPKTFPELFTTTPQATGADAAAAFRGQWTAREWAKLQAEPDLMAAARLAFDLGQERRAGIAPDHYRAAITCEACGPVWAWAGAPAIVQGCPWCANRADGLPIPRPAPITAAGAIPAHPAAFEDTEL